MDIISYGVANKAGKSEQHTRNDVLGQGVEGSFPHTKNRIDKLEEGIQNIVSQADKLIVNDTINIMKAHAQLNAIAKTTRYNMHNMIFDDLLDLSGIDTTKSSGYTHDAINGLINQGTIMTKEEVVEVTPSRAILTIEEESIAGYSNNYIPKLTSNTSASPIVVTASSISETAWKAFNRIEGDEWESNGNTEPGKGWIQVNFGEPIKISKYTIKPKSYNTAPYTWYLSGSKDGINFTILDYQESKAPSFWEYKGAAYKNEFVIDNSNEYQYYRISVTSPQPNGSPLELDEIEMMEKTVSEEIIGEYFISRDDGVTWEPIEPDTLFYFTDSISPQGNKLRLKAELPSGTKLLNYALTWA